MNDINNFIQFAKNNKTAERISGSNCIIYTRVSSKEQQEGYSLETQRKAIEHYAQKNNLYTIAYFGGTYESAKNDERKEFTRMLTFARRSKEKISYILVYSVDRFSRSGANAIFIASELRKENINIYAVTQPSDTATSSGKLQQNIQFIFSEYDNDLRKEKCVAGMKEKLNLGYWIQKAPLGYDQYTKHREQRITVNDTGKILRKAFYWKADDNLNNLEILERLHAAGVKVSHQQITEIFRNPFYCGIIRHNLLPGKVIQGKHEKLISEELFLRINTDKKRQNIKFKKEFEETPLKNFIKCGTCGTAFAGYIVKAKGFYYYKCNKKGCKCNKSAKILNLLFKDYLKDFEILKKHIEPIKDEFVKYIVKTNDSNKDNVKLFKAQLTDVVKKIETLEEKFIQEEINRELYDKFLLKYKTEKNNIEEKIGSTRLDLSNLENQIKKYVNICLELPSLWEKASFHAKMEIQNIIFPEGILYDRENSNYRTPKVNSVISLITSIARGLEEGIKRKAALLGGLSNVVGTTDEISKQLLDDIEVLANLEPYLNLD